MRIEQVILLTFVATVGFAIYFRLRDKKLLLAAGLCGAVGYGVYVFSKNLFIGDALPTLLAAMTVGLMGEWLSRVFKAPALIMILPGIVPLVPGGKLYQMMVHFVQSDFLPALDQAAQTTFIAGAISLGILAASVFSVSLRRMRHINIRGKGVRK